MNRRAALAVVVLLGLSGCAHHPAPNVEDQVRRLTAGLAIEFDADGIVTSEPYGLHRFSHTASTEWPYGEGFAVVSPGSKAVVWVYLHHGDFPPHDLHWADFDGDGKLDLFFHAGEEDVAESYVYLNRVSTNGFSLANFVQAYAYEDAYAVVLDFEGDGRPELLEPEPWGSADVDVCSSDFQRFEQSSAEVNEEYRRLAGSFANWNFKYGVAEEQGYLLCLFERIQIRSVGKAPQNEQVRDHLKWRIRMLTLAQQQLSPECRPRVADVIRHLQKALGQDAP